MSLLRFIRLLLDHKWLLVLFPASLAIAVFFLTRHTKREYAANSLVYTGLASGYTLESGADQRIDYFAVNNAFDNLINTIKARTNLEEVGIRLLASHLMMRAPDRGVANDETINHLHQVLPERVIKEVVDYNSLNQTVENIYRYSQIPKNIIAEQLLNKNNGPYSVRGIMSNLTVAREGTSDMVKITYTANDPAVVKHTVELITSVFMRRYRDMKVSETSNVVTYFEEQLRKATEKLAGSENKLKEFSSQNNIINYDEQTRSISAQDREIELEIQKVTSELQASKAALKDLEGKLSIRQDIALKNQAMHSLRDTLAILNSRLAMLEVQPESSQADIQKLRTQIGQYEHRARSSITDLYDANNSKNGVPSKLLFADWIDAFVGVDKNEARLLVLSDIKRNHGRHYKQMAPLGSGLSRLEREINVAEKEYLEILHGLNVSKLREQNLLLSTNLKVIDPPKFPAQPEPSKRLILVIAAFVVGFMLIISYIIGKEYFDWSLKRPTRAEKQIGVPFVGGLPLVDTSKSYVHYGTIEDRTLNQCVARIRRMAMAVKQQPVWILVFSVKEGTGKSHFARKLQRKLTQEGSLSLWLNPDGESNGATGEYTYQWQPDLGDLETLQSQVYVANWEQVKFVFVELPALLNFPLLTRWVQQAGFSLLVADATAVWNTSDRYALQNYLDTSVAPVGLLLNQVRHDQLEELIGEVPRDRSSLRQWLKHLLVPTSVIHQHPEKSSSTQLLYASTSGMLTSQPNDFEAPRPNNSDQATPDDEASVARKRRNRRRKSSPQNWLLRGAMFIGIIAGVALVWWMISPNAKGQNFWLYWFNNSSQTTEETTSNMPAGDDSLSVNGIAPIDSAQPLVEADAGTAIQDDWDAAPVPAPAPVESKPLEVKPAEPVASEAAPPKAAPTKVAPAREAPAKVAPVAEKPVAEKAPAAEGKTVYYIQAGSFKDRNNAALRQRDLMGGGYRAKIHDPQQPGGYYTVTAGPYQNFKVAQDEAESIGFILEIKTSVIKKQE
ncbi:SPOR domain-containing protein [Telluribacter sp. SYSU D00476]|uniref:SPOR domain-containing protein n=1 Tax=Telluribacter sp. SYSU D00476 TaxID=2811430 RepID=UPI001FF23A3F|nr:SPOR domain-containing protein [Telluribacter sp. SYSU D00476]